MSVQVPHEKAPLTKRGVLAKLAKIYDPLGLISPETLRGKLIYRSVCDKKSALDSSLSRDLERVWTKWESSLPQNFEVLRSLVVYREEIEQLVAGHMAENLATNVREALEGLPLKSTHCWLDSLSSLVLDQGASRVQAVRIQWCPQDQQS